MPFIADGAYGWTGLLTGAECKSEPGCQVSDFPRLAGIKANFSAVDQVKAVPSGQEVQFICADPSHIMYTVSEPFRVIVGDTFVATCSDATKKLDGVLSDAVCKPGTAYNFINVNLVRRQQANCNSYCKVHRCCSMLVLISVLAAHAMDGAWRYYKTKSSRFLGES